MRFRTPYLPLAGAALLLAGAAVAQDDEPQQKERTFEKRVVIVNGDEHDRLPFEHLFADKDLDCTEENGKKICTARMGPMHHLPGFGGTFLGVELTDSTPELREHLGAPRDGGVLVSRIQEESPAAIAGIEVGDIITAVEGETVESARDLRHAIASREGGATVKIDLYRDGRPEQVSATLGKREPHDVFKYMKMPPGMLDAEELSKTIDEALQGIDFEELDATVRQRLEEIDWDKIRETVREALDQAVTHTEKDDK